MYTRVLLLAVLCALISCRDDCLQSATCEEHPPANEVCLALFNRWFYNKSTNQCELIGYSGCSQLGFETELACEQCLCFN